MPELMVQIDGKTVPLSECGWFERRPCGCIVSALVAIVDSRVIATADQATRHWNPTKRERDLAAREGITVELMTMADYREHIGTQWECEQHAEQAAS
jgi:hypothetical protein